MQILRFFKHLFRPPWFIRQAFPNRSLKAIESAIAASERSHLGELRFVIENALDFADLRRGLTARQRAIEVFSQCRVWDTEYNSGVLIYLLLAERDIEIVADRGINTRVGAAVWEEICRNMEARFGVGEFEQGTIEGINAITKLLQQHFPASAANPNELENAPILLS